MSLVYGKLLLSERFQTPQFNFSGIDTRLKGFLKVRFRKPFCSCESIQYKFTYILFGEILWVQVPTFAKEFFNETLESGVFLFY